MGLDAGVFWNERNLPEGLLPHMYQIEDVTGEYSTYEEYDHLRDEFYACRRRLTNMGGAGMLSQQLRDLGLPEESVLLQKVLYSGTHCGDFIPMGEIPQLEAEIASIRLKRSTWLARLWGRDGYDILLQVLGDLKDLIAAAKREGNPIVFVSFVLACALFAFRR